MASRTQLRPLGGQNTEIDQKEDGSCFFLFVFHCFLRFLVLLRDINEEGINKTKVNFLFNDNLLLEIVVGLFMGPPQRRLAGRP